MPAFITGGSGSNPVLKSKTVTSNRIYYASSDDADGYYLVDVQVPSGVRIQDKTVTPTTNQQEITCDASYDALGTVTVKAIKLQSKEVTPATSVQIINPSYSYDGLSSVKVYAIPSEYIIPSGTLYINNNTPSQDVSTYKYVNVNVPGATLFQSLINGDITNVSSTDFGNATQIVSYAFYGQTNLTTVAIPDTITNIGNYSFAYCSVLENIIIPNGVNTIGSYTFAYCSGLTTITIPNSVTTIGSYAFRSCTNNNFTSILIPNSVTNINAGILRGCSNLRYIEIGNAVSSIGSFAFTDCSSLVSITIKTANPPTLSNTNAFNSTNNCPIYVPNGAKSAYISASGWSTLESRIQEVN